MSGAAAPRGDAGADASEGARADASEGEGGDAGRDDAVLDGGCLCGAVRYRLRARPVDCGWCHCALCRGASGAPALVFATVPIESFAWTRGAPRLYRSTPTGRRWFCGDCGTALCMRVDREPDTIDVTVASLDVPAAAPPGHHIWDAARLPWFEPCDALPRHPGNREDGGGA